MFKKILAIGFLLAATQSFGQIAGDFSAQNKFRYDSDDDSKIGVIKWNPLLALSNNWHFSYEHAIMNEFSVQASLGFLRTPKIFGVQVKGSGGGIGARYYFGGTALKGIYGSGWLEYYQSRVFETRVDALGVSSTISVDLSTPTGTLAVGYQFVSSGGFTVDANVGGSAFGARGELTGFNRSFTQYFGGVSPRIGFNIGYAF